MADFERPFGDDAASGAAPKDDTSDDCLMALQHPRIGVSIAFQAADVVAAGIRIESARAAGCSCARPPEAARGRVLPRAAFELSPLLSE
jgi:hypothetical protein